MKKLLGLLLAAIVGANANPAPHVGADNLLGAALEKDHFTVTDMGTYYSITRSAPNENNPPAELVKGGDGNGNGERKNNGGNIAHN